MKTLKSRNKQNGFTFIEVIIVMVFVVFINLYLINLILNNTASVKKNYITWRKGKLSEIVEVKTIIQNQ